MLADASENELTPNTEHDLEECPLAKQGLRGKGDHAAPGAMLHRT